MKLRPSEEHIRSLFKNHEQPLDTDKLWEELQKKNKPKRRLIWLRFLGLMLPLFLIGGYLILNSNGEDLDDSISTLEQNSTTVENINNATDKNVLDKNIEEKNDTEGDLAGANEKTNLVSNYNNPQLASRNINGSTPIDQFQSDNKINKSKVSSDLNLQAEKYLTNTNNNIDESQNIEQKKFIDDTQSPLVIRSKNITADGIQEISKSSTEANTISLDQIADTDPEKDKTIKNSINNFITMDKTFSENKVGRTSKIPVLENILFYDRPLALVVSEVKAIPVLEEEQSNRYRTLSVIAGVGLGNKNLKARDFRDTLYIQARKDAEKIHSIWNGAVKLGFHKNNFLFNTGISYRHHIESLRYSSRNTSRTEEDGPISIIVDGQGNILSTQNGVITTTITTNYDFLKRNRYHYLGIPVEMGADFSIGKFKLGLLASSEISMAIKRSGAYLDTPDSFLDFSAEESIIDYDKTILFQLGLRSTLSYAIKENVHFTIQPYAMRYINSMTTAVNSLEERPTHFGVDFGVVYRLTK